MNRMIKLSNRLQTIADIVEKDASVIDVATDHGHLPVYLALTGLARRIIASDMSAGSLEAAHRTAAKFGVTDKIKFIVAPGLAGIDEDDVETIVIAGVGGETILGILDDAPWTKRGKKLVLQPQTKIETLRCWLKDAGYAIQEEKLVADKGRTYTVLIASAHPESQL